MKSVTEERALSFMYYSRTYSQKDLSLHLSLPDTRRSWSKTRWFKIVNLLANF